MLEQRTRYNETNGAYGAFVVATNASFGVDFGDPANFPIWCAIYDSLGEQGVLNCGATANLNIDIDVEGDVPTACPSDFMISVTNTTDTDAKNNGAAYGLTTIDLGAPGTSILNTDVGNSYSYKTGTSMATPTVAGAIALMFSAANSGLMSQYKSKPAETALLFRDWLLAGVDPIPALQGITVTGGRLNVYNSLLLVKAFADSLDPGEPVNPAAYSDYMTPNSMDITWEDPTSFAGGDTLLPGQFQIEIMRDSSLLASVPGGVMQYTDSGLTDGQLYEYTLTTRVIATDSLSNPVSASWIAGGSPIPAAPKNLACTADSVNIILTWEDPLIQNDGTPLDDLSMIRIYRDGTLIDSVAPGTETYTDSPNPGSFYNYYITAIDNETPQNESSQSQSVGCYVGSTPDALVWVGADASGSSAESGDSLFKALVENGVSAFLTNNLFEFGSNLSAFKAIFVVLGVFNDNHILGNGDPEAGALESYLAGGGRLYMEGGDCFNYDPGNGGYNVRPWFGIDDGPDGSGDVSGITGLNDLSPFGFSYVGENSWMDELLPLASVSIWKNSTETDISGVWNTNFGAAKTIGVVPSFGGLVDNPNIPMHPELRMPSPPAPQDITHTLKQRSKREPIANFQKKVAFPRMPLTKDRKKLHQLYQKSPEGVEVFANTKVDLMAAYLGLLDFPGFTGGIQISHNVITQSLSPGDSASVLVSVINSSSDNLHFSLVEDPPVDWLSITPDADTLAVGDSTILSVIFNTDNLNNGSYHTAIKLSSNDLQAPEITIPVMLDVNGVAIIEIQTDSLSFGNVLVGESASQNILLFNNGSADLMISGMTFPYTAFSTDASFPLTIAPNDSGEITFTFSPDSVVVYSGMAHIFNNDPANDTLSVYLEGEGETAVGIAENTLPQNYAVSENYPNPFNPSTSIRYQLPQASMVSLEIFNILGQRVRRLLQGQKSPGYYETTWNGQNDYGESVGSGIYIYRFSAENLSQNGQKAFVFSKKMILIK